MLCGNSSQKRISGFHEQIIQKKRAAYNRMSYNSGYGKVRGPSYGIMNIQNSKYWR